MNTFALNSHQSLMRDVSRDLMGGDLNFPTGMNVAIAIRDALSDPNTSIDQLSALVCADPLLAAKVLHMANCVTLNPSGQSIISVSQAVSRLGFNVVRAVSLVMAMQQLSKSKEMAVFAPLSQTVWEHSIQVAALSRVLAKRLGRANADEAMLAGLVSDMGVFYLMYRAAAFDEYRQDTTLLNDLLQRFKSTIGILVLEALRLPAHVVAALKGSDALQDEKTARLHELLHLAQHLSCAGAEWFSTDEEKVSLDRLAELQQAYAELLEDCQSDLKEIKSALSH